MKKPLYTLLILIMLTLTACAGQAPVAHRVNYQSADQMVSYNKSVESSAASGDGIPTDFENAESQLTQMILGLIKLDGTTLALTKDQATTILPLWDEYQKEMMNAMPVGGHPGGQPGEKPADGSKSSGTPAAPPTPDASTTPAAPAQNSTLDTLTTKMVAALTADQIKAISEMKITKDIATTIMKENGITEGGPDDSQQGGQPSQSGTRQAPTGDQHPADGQQPPAGGQPPADGKDNSGSSTGQSGQPGQPPSGSPRGGMLQPGLMKAFTTLLEKVSGNKSTAAFEPAGINPAGQFPGGQMPGDQGQVGMNNSSSQAVYGAVYQQNGGNETKSDQTINAIDKDQSAILVTDSGVLNITKSKISTSGNTSSQDSSSFVGLNAAVLATSGAKISVDGSTITTTGEGANGAFATGSGSTVNLTNVVIDAAAGGAHGVMATKGGVVNLHEVNITTRGESSGALATDRGSGTITAEDVNVLTTGNNSPAIYSTGIITVNNGIMSSTSAESAVIEGANSISLNNSRLTSSMDNKWGVMIYQSMSGDAEGTRGTFSMTGGELSNTAAEGPLFFITNSTGIIDLTGVAVTANSGELINASANRWGNEGTNGGTVIFTANGQSLTGSITADSISSVELTLKNSSILKSTINPTDSAREIKITLDASSSWVVTANSYITCLADPDGISDQSVANIQGNGFTVYYNSTQCPVLGGKTYSLEGDGVLTPAS